MLSLVIDGIKKRNCIHMSKKIYISRYLILSHNYEIVSYNYDILSHNNEITYLLVQIKYRSEIQFLSCFSRLNGRARAERKTPTNSKQLPFQFPVNEQ